VIVDHVLEGVGNGFRVLVVDA
jgi:hypothetical protein